mmetsp:Transcript_26255/g.66767  ORF Transcript_26255/g.66767 Transcript_26255/m.66767 type:complete len:679 (-) Transcript_26255:2350-4386(-)
MSNDVQDDVFDVDDYFRSNNAWSELVSAGQFRFPNVFSTDVHRGIVSRRWNFYMIHGLGYTVNYAIHNRLVSCVHTRPGASRDTELIAFEFYNLSSGETTEETIGFYGSEELATQLFEPYVHEDQLVENRGAMSRWEHSQFLGCEKTHFDYVISGSFVFPWLRNFSPGYLFCAGMLSSSNTDLLLLHILERIGDPVPDDGASSELPGMFFNYVDSLLPYGYVRAQSNGVALRQDGFDVYAIRQDIQSLTPSRVYPRYVLTQERKESWLKRKEWAETERVMFPLSPSAFYFLVDTETWTEDSSFCSKAMMARCMVEEGNTGRPFLHARPECIAWASKFPSLSDDLKTAICQSGGLCDRLFLFNERELDNLIAGSPLDLPNKCTKAGGIWTPMTKNTLQDPLWKLCRCMLLSENTNFKRTLKVGTAFSLASLKRSTAGEDGTSVVSNVPVSFANVPPVCFYYECQGDDLFYTSEMEAQAQACGDVVLTCTITNVEIDSTNFLTSLSNKCGIDLTTIDASLQELLTGEKGGTETETGTTTEEEEENTEERKVDASLLTTKIQSWIQPRLQLTQPSVFGVRFQKPATPSVSAFDSSSSEVPSIALEPTQTSTEAQAASPSLTYPSDWTTEALLKEEDVSFSFLRLWTSSASIAGLGVGLVVACIMLVVFLVFSKRIQIFDKV